MRIVSRSHHVFDNPVKSQFELYRNGAVIGIAKYQIHGDRMVFMLCQTAPGCSPEDRRSFYLAALRDAHHRRLGIAVTSRSMTEELRSPRRVPNRQIPALTV